MSQELSGEALPSVDIRTFYIGRVRDEVVRQRDPPRPRRPAVAALPPHSSSRPWLYFPDGRGAP